jgi:cysteine-rich repeat protein
VICSDCGNGHKQPHEQCDDGNAINGDGCSQDCKEEFLFGSDNEGNIFMLDTEKQKVKNLGPLPLEDGSTEIECGVGGFCFSQGRDGTFEIDRVNFRPLDVLSSVSDGASFNGLEFVYGALYGTAITQPCVDATLYLLDPLSGAKVEIGPVNTGRPMSGLAYDIKNNKMYGVDGCGSEGASHLYTVDLATGQATAVGNTGKRLGSLEFGPDGKLYAGGDSADGGNIYSINPATGEATFVVSSGFGNVTGLTLSVLP